MLDKSHQVLIIRPDSTLNSHKIVYSETEEIMLDFKGDSVEKKDRVIIMILDKGSSKRIGK